MGKRLSGGTWLGLSMVLLLVTVVSTFFVWAANSSWGPDERPESYWQERIATLQGLMATAMLIPAASAACAGLAIFTRPRRSSLIVGGLLVAGMTLTAFFASWWLGVEAVESAKYWANWHPGAARRPR